MIEHRKFVCSDCLNNNNKFWEYLYDTDTSMVTVKYGRIGKTSTEDPPKQMSRTELDRRIREKVNGRGKEGTPSYKPPYREIAIVAESSAVTGPSVSVDKTLVKEAAKQQLAASNPDLVHLIERLVEANRHELHKASGGKMDIDLRTGIISTPIGVITKDTVNQARDVLNLLDPFVVKRDFDDKKFIEHLNSYLMLVPQTVGHARGWHRDFFNTRNTLVSQNTLLDQLDASADLAAARLESAKKSSVQTTLASTPDLFNAQLSIVTDKTIIKDIEKRFFDTVNSMHESRNMKPIRFYKVEFPNTTKAFEAKLDAWKGKAEKNVWMLWHGTRMFNVLSILKNSLFCPPRSGSFHVTGRMFGDGIYGSDQSTKALNYARGYWDGGTRDKNCFMFLVDFAMGDYFVPSGPNMTLPRPGYDSTFAKAHKSGVMNNEMIVYSNDQVNIRYLVEFEEK